LNDAIEREVRFCSFDEAGSKLIRQIKQVPSMDANNVHGGLSALTQIASLLGVTDDRRANVSWFWVPNIAKLTRQIFLALGSIRPAALVSPQAGPIIRKACEVICATLNQAIINSAGSQAVLDKFIEAGMKRRETECQEGVADVYGCLSAQRNASREVVK
jgi:hypothetical protein